MSLSNIVNHLGGRIHIIKCKYGHDNKKYQTCGIKYKTCDCNLKYTQNLCKQHNLYVQGDVLLLADVFENFRNMFLEIYKLDPACFLTEPRLAQQTTIKKGEIKFVN